MILIAVCFTILIANSAARSALSNYDEEEHMNRRAMLEALLETVMKRNEDIEKGLQVLAQHKNDQAVKNIGNDYVKLGQAINQYVASGDQASLNEARKDIEDYVDNLKKEPLLLKFVAHLFDSLSG